MKILLTTDQNPTQVNGVVVSVLNLKKDLEKKGQDVRLLCLSPTKQSYIEDNIYYIGSIPFNIYPDIRASFNVRNELVDQLIAWHPDIIHSQCEFFTYSFVQRIAKQVKCPIVHTYHTMYEHYVRYALPIGNWARLVKPVMRMRLKTADVVIAPTRKMRDNLYEGNVSDDIRIIPTGIDLEKYDQRISAERKAELLRGLRIPEGARVIGSVGRLAEEKNFSEILRALQELLKERSDVYLVLTGDGAYRKKLEEETGQLGLLEHVRFPGMIAAEHIYEYYQILEIFLSASVSETQGLTYIEALSNGLPVIARKDGAIDGVVEDGKNGFQYTTLPECVHRLSQLLDDGALLRTLSENARNSRQRFGTEAFGTSVLKLYHEVLNRENPPVHLSKKWTARWSAKIINRTKRSDYGQFYATIQSKLSRARFQKQRSEQELDS
ncbi:MAG: glycosyltransferase [Ndongobacter sp.]|nr:glycosyltransferase [Ndongobacter sp.]